MSVFNDVLENARIVAEKVGEKANCAYDVTKLNLAKNRIKAEIKSKYQLLGKCYYESSKEDASTVDCTELISQIDELYAQLKNILAQIDSMKNIRRCPVCHQPSNSQKPYCSSCGNKF